MADGPIVAGALAHHPLANDLALVVQRIHHRYASEIVGAFSLCPFMNDPASAFGRFCVMLDRQLDLASAEEQVLAAPGVVHLVYPLVSDSSQLVERFGNALHEAVRKESFKRGLDSPPVHATFHPEMDGDTTSAQRLVGYLRRAPDPFVQFVPQGLAQGGTMFADLARIDLGSFALEAKAKRDLLSRLSPADRLRISELQAQIRAERDKSYARFLDALS
jgi:hypothetical protein